METSMNKVKQMGTVKSTLIKGFIYTIFIIVAIYLGGKSFQIYHTMVEIFGITIGFVMLTIAMATYKLSEDHRVIFLGIAFGFTALLDLLHFITYKNTGLIEISNFNVSIQLWTVSRYLQSISILICFLSRNKKFDLMKILFTYITITVLLITSIIYTDIFPDCYVEGTGFTPFKIIGGQIDIIILFISLIYLVIKANGNLDKIDKNFIFAILSSIICGLFFMSSSVNYDSPSILGHIFQFSSFYYIYISLVQSSIQQPHYSLIKLNDVLVNKNEKLEGLVEEIKLEHEYRKKLEYEKERRRQTLDGILESVLEGILVVNKDRKIIHVNSQFINMLDVNFEITSETTDWDLIDILKEQTLNSEEFVEGIKEEWESNKEYIKHIHFKNGKTFEASSVPFYDNGLLTGKLIIYRDITEKIKIEKLQKQVKIRQELLKKAKEYDELKTSFFCTVSHELKTPINIILGVIQLLSSIKQTDFKFIKQFSSNKYINIMKQNSYRLIKLSDNLIDITKIDAGYTEMKLRNHNIVSIIEDITLSVADYIESKDISLIFDTDVEERIMACDDEKLERVMLNLLSNAVKFTESKGNINVDIKNYEDYIIISVKDSGIGIPENKKEIIFDRFRQVDSTLRRAKEGSGIGLALVKSIVEKHGGKISLESEIDRGSEFIIELPVKIIENEIINETSQMREINREINVDRINIEFSDIYELNIH